MLRKAARFLIHLFMQEKYFVSKNKQKETQNDKRSLHVHTTILIGTKCSQIHKIWLGEEVLT